MQITGTFIDEISHDIPHQNWGSKEWDADFAHMKRIGINTVILIRSGYRRFLTYPSQYLIKNHGCFRPPVDLVQLFLELSEKYQMRFFFGTYDSGKYWDTGNMSHEIDINKYSIDEVFQKYGHFQCFGGWYLSLEMSRKTKGAIKTIAELGLHCKNISNGLPVMISPWIDGKKAVMSAETTLLKESSVSLKQHEKDWDEIFDGIKDYIDIVAFQDGHVDYHELEDYLSVNKFLADKYGITSWTNLESFDRDMPIKFFPIKFEKLLLKLAAAKKVGIQKAITFEFSHFMSPQSAYIQAHHLYQRYMEHFNIEIPKDYNR
ncbi:DUF4434 domain-containing protein [Arenibacter sp. GZD96]|uniref:DUF4434 domain-containing protein n=1 Tax=Aurantibrevibacter litoralis TaxID=3106030 RepID=UPI002AFE7D63|nr:DUF4434 domain-containing protein [Arenibacter sp. GZD-96]MEA1784814.1 DUF4434 domain-containing protein [Arenibacter sp. GZD-96]